MSWRYRMTGKAPNPAQQGTPRRLPEHTTPLGRWVMAAVAVVLALLTGQAKADGYIGLSIGRTHAPAFFDFARFAFPDLAQGGPGCCNQVDATDETANAFQFTLGKTFANGFGIEGSLARLGSYDSAFTVSGPFGGSVLGAGQGQCEESGRFRFTALTLAGTWNARIAGAVLVPRLGLSAVRMDYETRSHCALAGGSVYVEREDHRTSLAPMVGLGLKLPLTETLNLTLAAERRFNVTVGDTQESRDYGQGTLTLSSVWLGIERRF